MIRFPVTRSTIAKAKRIRAERDAQYGNRFAEAPRDKRYAGDLGEILVAEWLRLQEVPFEWITTGDTRGQPDLRVCGHSIDVKTRSTIYTPNPRWSSVVTADQVDEHRFDYFLFAAYVYTRAAFYILGGIECEGFRYLADLCLPGDDAGGFIVRPGHRVYSISNKQLIEPSPWLWRVAAPLLPNLNQ